MERFDRRILTDTLNSFEYNRSNDNNALAPIRVIAPIRANLMAALQLAVASTEEQFATLSDKVIEELERQCKGIQKKSELNKSGDSDLLVDYANNADGRELMLLQQRLKQMKALRSEDPVVKEKWIGEYIQTQLAQITKAVPSALLENHGRQTRVVFAALVEPTYLTDRVWASPQFLVIARETKNYVSRTASNGADNFLLLLRNTIRAGLLPSSIDTEAARARFEHTLEQL